jgi:hypothetical protein
MKKIFIIFILIFVPLYIYAVNSKYDISKLSPQKAPSGKWGYLDDKGNYRIKPIFELALPFKEGLAVVSVSNKFGFIDGLGRPVIRFQFDNARNFCDGLAAVMIVNQNMAQKWGYIDKTGQFLIEAKFDEASDFSNGSAEVTLEDKTFLINKSGCVINN